MRGKGLVVMVLVVVVGVFVFLSADHAPALEAEGTSSDEQWHDVKLPHKLTFAGENVPLEYFDVRESLEREIISNTYFHSQTIYLIKRMGRYMPTIERILKKHQIPEDFKYLAVAESILRDKAKSPVGAAGVWQLMSSTARELGLEVNSNVDERYNLELATEAACQYLLKSYEKYENWTLVAASYNMGRRALDRSIKYQKQDNYFNMYLNAETARYVYRILAFKLILRHPEKYGFRIRKKDRYQPFSADTILVNYPIEHLADFAKANGMNYKTLKIVNPWFLENHLNNASKKEYKVLIVKDRDL